MSIPLKSINQFYTNLREEIPPGTTPSIISCLKALENLNLGEPDSTAIQKLAMMVKAATEPSKPSKEEAGSSSAQDLTNRKLAQAIADSVVRTHFFGEIEREDRDVFLRASSNNPHNFFMRFLELGRMAWNRIRYSHGQSKENQNNLCRQAGEALQRVVESLPNEKIAEEDLSSTIADEFVNTFKSEHPIPGQNEFREAFTEALREVPAQNYRQWIDVIRAQKAFEEKKADLIERAKKVPGNKALLSELGTAITDKDLIPLEERIQRRELLLGVDRQGNPVQKLIASNALTLLADRWDEAGAENVILSASTEEASLQEGAKKLFELQKWAEKFGKDVPLELQKSYIALTEHLKKLSSPTQDIGLEDFCSDLKSRAEQAERACNKYFMELNSAVLKAFKEFDAEKEVLRQRASAVEAEAAKLGLRTPLPNLTDIIDEKVRKRTELENIRERNDPRIAGWMDRWRGDFKPLQQEIEDLSLQISVRKASIEEEKQKEIEKQKLIKEQERIEREAKEKRLDRDSAAEELPHRTSQQVEPPARPQPAESPLPKQIRDQEPKAAPAPKPAMAAAPKPAMAAAPKPAMAAAPKPAMAAAKRPVIAAAPKPAIAHAQRPVRLTPPKVITKTAQKPVAALAPEPVAVPLQQPIPIERFREAFGKNADRIHSHVMSLLPQMAHNAKTTGRTQKRSKMDPVPFEVKYRFVDGQPQITISQYLGRGSYKTIKKVLLVAGPAISACGDLFAYGKLLYRKSLKDIREMEKEISISQLLNRDILPGENSNIIKYYRVTHRKNPSLKGVGIKLCSGDAVDVTTNIANYTLKERLTIARDAANGLSRMNAAGLCHLDFKPGNLLIKREAPGKVTALVSDFGLTERAGTATSGGTLCYMPPSILKGTQTLASADIDSWSLGLLIFELLVGQSENPLFYPHLNVADFKAANVRKPEGRWNVQYKILMEKASRLTPPFNTLVGGLLDLNPKTRWSSTDARNILDEYIGRM